MRPWEWFLFLALLPALLLARSPRTPLPGRWRIAAGALPVLLALAHLLLEGWRTQMIPLYALTGLVAAQLFWARGAAWRRPRALLSALLALVYIGGGLLPGWLLPVFALPAPTGPYPVGIVDREIADAARGRRLMVSVWYPAERAGPPARLTAHPDAVAAGVAGAFGAPFAAPALQHLRYIAVAASAGAPVAARGAPFPVLVFSHGLTGLRLQNSSEMQELASRGYVVVALDHTDAAAITVFPDGEERPFDLGRLGIGPDQTEQSTTLLLPIWVADQRAVYDTLAAWAAGDPLLAGRLDLGRIGSFGHSFGGATSLEVCRVDARCRAAINLDGGVGEGALPPSRPFLLLTSTASGDLDYAVRRWSGLVACAPGPAYWLELPASNHFSLTIFPLLTPLATPRGGDARASLRTVDRYVGAFFDRYLRDLPTPLLDPASGETDVRWHPR